MVKSLPCSALGAGLIPAQGTMGFPGGSDSKASEQRGGPGFDPWVGKIPWKRKWQPTPVLLSGKSHGRRSLAGYSPWGRNESAMTEQLSLSFSTKKDILSSSLLLFRCSVMPHFFQCHGLQQAMLPCPSLHPRVCSNSCPLS